MNSKWEKTSNALKGLLDILTCSKCKKNLHDPQQFLHCGHFSCISCIKNETTKCFQCEILCENNGFIRDETIAKIVQACCTIAQEIGSRDDIKNVVKEFNKASSTEQVQSISNIVGDNEQTNNSENLPNHSRNKSSKKTKKRKGKSSLINNQASKKIKSDITAHALRIPKNINKKNHLGETLLHEKCKKGHTIYVQKLLEAGADPNTSCAANWIPLQEAVTGGFYEITKMLLEAKADVNQQGYEGRTALHEAVEEQNSKIIQLLLRYGAKKDLVDKNNKMPIDYCQSEEIKGLLNEETIEDNGCTKNDIRISNNNVEVNNEKPLDTENNNSNMLRELSLCDDPSTKESYDNTSSSKFNDNISRSNNDEDEVAIVFENLSSSKNGTNHLQETADNCSSQQSIDVVNCDTKDGAINILNNISQRNIDLTNKKEFLQEIINDINYDEHSQAKVGIMNENDNVKESSQASLADSEEIIVD